MSASSGFTSATSGVNYLSSITSSAGSRTVYVRAVNSDTANYATPSSNSTKAVTVYSVALTKGAGINSVTGAGNYISNATVTLGATVGTGYTWSKWTQTSGGNQVSTTNAYSSAITSNWAYTANATANELTFGNQTISKTYSTSEQTASITAATNGTGTYTYAIQSQKNTSGTTVNYFSLTGTTLKIAANTPVNGSDYKVVIRATDSGSGVTKDATYTVTIGKQTVNPPTNVAVGTDGKVTWTASSNATGYEISMNASSGFTSATSGVNYLSSITSSTGSRTVYVRAVNSDTANYATPSSNASKAVTVYKVSLTKGTGISSVTGAGNYISGATVTLGATASTGYTWSKWTQTSGGSQVSTTNAYSAAISSNWTYTANATANDLVFNGTTISKTYSTSEQTASITTASNGTGTYTYEIKSQKNTSGTAVNYFTLLGTTLTIAANTPVNGSNYAVVITATDVESGATKDATTDGKVTWTASNNATGYEISMSASSGFTSATSGVDYLSTIIGSTGNRTVYVRAVNSDTANYATPSSNASKAVTVYSVTLTKGTGISAVTGAGNYISGATVTLGATVSTGYTWSKWTQTSGGTQVSTTKGYSAAITSNWAYTANATDITAPTVNDIEGGTALKKTTSNGQTVTL